jgi:CheY-like chemotaxis protein
MSSSPALPAILIAEDDPNDLFLLQRALVDSGVRNPIQTFGNGIEIIEHLKRLTAGTASPFPRPGLLFLDLHLPQIDGRAVIAWIKHQPLLRALRVVVVSGSSQPADLNAAASLGADRVLVKPPGEAVLIEEVGRLNGVVTA